jgi:hypothetical protein
MGGLVIRAALAGTQSGEAGFPPYLHVEDVTTLATPHAGIGVAFGCNLVGTQQCKDMAPGSDFFNWLSASGGSNPQGASGTDWTLIGFDDDLLVKAGSAVAANMSVRHKIVYPGGQFLPRLEAHMLPLSRTSGNYRIQYCDAFGSCDMTNQATWNDITGEYDPIRLARLANDLPVW